MIASSKRHPTARSRRRSKTHAPERNRLDVIGTQVHHGTTTEATDFVPPDRKARLVRIALWFIPRANPDFEPLFPQVRKWLVEIDESGQAQREIAVGANDTPLFAAPDERNRGFWTDSEKTFAKSELVPLSALEFEQLWSRACAEASNNALKGGRAKRARP